MTYAQTMIVPIQKRVIFFWVLVFALLSSFLLYTYFLNATVLHIVERKSVEERISETTLHISKLESRYMELSAAVTPELASSLGFVQPKRIAFVQEGESTGLAKLGE